MAKTKKIFEVTMGERVLVVGSGAREHALAYKLSLGDDRKKLSEREIFVWGGNRGIAQEFECIEPKKNGVMGVVEVAQRIQANLVVVGPEALLAQGVIDALFLHGISGFGPGKKAARLEASKSFMKTICTEKKIKSASYQAFSDGLQAKKFLEKFSGKKVVVKASGLCAGKGVSIFEDIASAQSHIDHLYEGGGFERLGTNDREIIIEEFLEGKEVSVFAMTNGHDLCLFPPMQDYKKQKDNDLGPNTGGMGAVGPLGETYDQTKKFLEKVKEEIFRPTLAYLQDQGILFQGLLYAGLLFSENQVNLLEFNVRFGDPETQALLFGLRADIYPLMQSIALNDRINFENEQERLLKVDPSACVVFASKSYPSGKDDPQLLQIDLPIDPDSKIFYASSVSDPLGRICAGSGRVLSLVSRGKSIAQARRMVYDNQSKIGFSGMQFRSDIGETPNELNL